MPLYLLDADTLITGDRRAYPIARFPVVWDWLRHQGELDCVRIAVEQYEEIVQGRGDLVDWLSAQENRKALLLDEEVDMVRVQQVTEQGYAADLNEEEIERVGRDPFLIAYALANPEERVVVTFEVSASSKKRANRKVPDVCGQFGIRCTNLYDLIRELDFSMDWRPPR